MTTGSKVKQTLASLKGAQSTLRIYAEQAQDEKIKQVFRQALEDTNVIVEEIEDRVREMEYEEPQFKGF
ncbi:MAG: DUF1657 domain-containing protein [Clostridia bacterium]